MAFPKGLQQGKITPKQQRFIKNYTEKSSKTFGNATRSYIAAGYKDGKSAQAAASQLLCNPVIAKSIAKHIAPTTEISLKRQEISKEYSLCKLQETYEKALDKGDITNQVACVRLMMQYNNLLTDRVVVSLEDSRQLEASLAAQAKQIASLIINQESGLGLNPALLPGISSAITEQQQPQDVVMPDNDAQAIIDSEFEDDSQVLENTEDMESCSDNK